MKSFGTIAGSGVGRRKMIYVKDLRRVNFGFHAQEVFPSQMCQGLESHGV